MWKPLWEVDTYNDKDDAPLRRVIIAGYFYDGGKRYAKVGEAYWGSPDGRPTRWLWTDGGDVVNALGYQDLPDFPVAAENNQYVVGRIINDHT